MARRRRLSGVARQVAPALVLAGLAGAVLITILPQFSYRAACAVIAGVCVIAAAMRVALPTSWVGVLAVRGRLVDVALYLLAAVGVVVLAFSVPLPGGGPG